ncbi:MAG: hypothetical protein GWO41_12465 [candidate division Zixibacteria bacterium]|nr:hypothetical protein [candidate division Zixibacteria bacterium]NIR67268.1 hypothetical protein [candidate division Zixibacteria bacterium]NIS16104.1 hypothetical protein [candidate division Zixibacteria bacterium]NIS48651.1 hypothetical protein [candidate division Zixibacteria bacterium]NIT53518.1 hypothetical protein [candidate division Zixibacteria bacterium]
MSDDRKKELLMKVVDELATEDEKREFAEFMEADSALEEEYRSFKEIKEVTDTIMFKDLPDSYWEGYWKGIYNRLERGIGWIFLSIGAIILLAFGAYHVLIDFFMSETVSLLVKAGVAIGGIGLIILLVSIAREVLFARKHERYKEVKY